MISKEEYKALVRESDQQKDAQASQGPEGQDKPGSKAEPGEEIISKEPLSSKLNLTEIGGPKKRKQAKIVGDDSVPEGKEKEEKLDGLSQKPKQKKKKKIKLSFDEE